MTEHESAVHDAMVIRDFPTRELMRLGDDGRRLTLTNDDGSVLVLVYEDGRWQEWRV